MSAILPSLSTLAVSAIFCIWQAYQRYELARRHRQLRERVAYMLWVMAQRLDSPSRRVRVCSRV
jgi:hypothetical protein